MSGKQSSLRGQYGIRSADKITELERKLDYVRSTSSAAAKRAKKKKVSLATVSIQQREIDHDQ